MSACAFATHGQGLRKGVASSGQRGGGGTSARREGNAIDRGYLPVPGSSMLWIFPCSVFLMITADG